MRPRKKIKDPAFQFVGDILGGYDTPWEMYSWFYYGGGLEAEQPLYHEHGMHVIGWWISGQESLSSTSPLESVADFKDWKFRSPPGIQTEIFAELSERQLLPLLLSLEKQFHANARLLRVPLGSRPKRPYTYLDAICCAQTCPYFVAYIA